MPQVLHPNARVDKLKEAGRTVISHILYDDAAEANLTGSDPLKTDISDGFYRIVQHRDDGTVADASLNLPSDVAVDTALPVQMEVDPGLHTRTWRLTRQYGIEDSFTIVPYKTPIEAVNKKRELGTTTFIKVSLKSEQTLV
ncbi:hypothetical protein FRC07_013549 [Ceratobasidium sp. 392]|nr:hypothetical protein FRC07_013549 [Ceratobasidium sp. 392]